MKDIIEQRKAINTLAELFTYLGENPTELQAFRNDQIAFFRDTSLTGEEKFIACFDLDRMNHHFVSADDSGPIESGKSFQRTLVAYHPDGSSFVNTITIEGMVDFSSRQLELSFDTLTPKSPDIMIQPKCSVVYITSISSADSAMEISPQKSEISPGKPRLHFHDEAKVVTIGPRMNWTLTHREEKIKRNVYLTGFIDCKNGRVSLKFSEDPKTDW